MALPTTQYALATLANPSAALTDFSLLIDLSRMPTAWWDLVDTTNGRRGRAAKDDGVTELATHWFGFDSVGRTGYVRVKWAGTLAATGAQRIRIYPPIAANAVYIDTDAFGSDNAYDSEWDQYWPFEVDSQNAIRTGSGMLAVAGSGPAPSVGMVGGRNGMVFDGTNHLQGDVNIGPFTEMAVFGRYNSSIPGVLFGMSFNSAVLRSDRFMHDNANGSLVTGGTFVQSAWTSVGAANFIDDAFFYQDGADVTSGITSSGSPIFPFPPTQNLRLTIGARVNGFDEHVAGALSHLSIHTSPRPSQWFDYEHLQTGDQAAAFGTWTLEGGATPAADLNVDRAGTPVLDGGTVSLGDVLQGSTQQVVLTIANDGTAEASIGTVTFTGSASLVGQAPLTIAASTSTNLTVAISTATLGAANGTVSIPSNDPDSPYDITITANVVAPDLVVTSGGTPVADGGLVDAGSAQVGTPLSVTVDITNTGNTAATEIVVGTTGALSRIGGTLGTQLAASATASVVLDIDTASLGLAQGTLSIASSDPSSPLDLSVNAIVEDDMPAPVIINSSPADGVSAADGALTKIILLWIEAVSPSTGNFFLYKDGVLFKTVAASSTTVDSFNANQQTIPLDEPLGFSSAFHLLWDAGVVTGNASQLPNAANTDPLALNFSTGSAAAADPSIRSAYLTVSEATAVINEVMGSGETLRRAWEASSAEDKVKHVTNASIDFDSVRWIGRPAAAGQPNAWPRLSIRGERLSERSELDLPAALGTTAWIFPGLPAEVRIGVAVQAAARAAGELRVDSTRELSGRASTGLTGMSGAGVNYTVEGHIARMPRSVLHWAVLKIVNPYLPGVGLEAV